MKEALLKVPSDERGIFKERKNRFLGSVKIGNETVEVHVRDPGRLNEILYPGNEVLLKRAENQDRKTDWSLLAGRVDEHWVFVNSGYHRAITERILEKHRLSPFERIEGYQAEKKLGKSRIDFLLKKDDRDIWLEVKGCTLAEDGTALFPDAPTKRGKRHVEELIQVKDKKTDAALIVLVFRPDAKCFSPNKKTDPDFTAVFERGVEEGLSVHPISLKYTEDKIYYIGEIPLC